jgi:hypothetical protein
MCIAVLLAEGPMIALIRQYLAKRRLQALVEANRNSFTTQDYARRRAAAKLGIDRKRGMA